MPKNLRLRPVVVTVVTYHIISLSAIINLNVNKPTILGVPMIPCDNVVLCGASCLWFEV